MPGLPWSVAQQWEGLGSDAWKPARVIASSVRRAGRGLIAATEFIKHFMAPKAGERGQDDQP